MDNGGEAAQPMAEWMTDEAGNRWRVHREYVDVIARFDRFGSVEPVSVIWRDGRRFPVDEVIDTAICDDRLPPGRSRLRYRVRFGGHETDLFLERGPARGGGEALRWWVRARDQVRPGPRLPDAGLSDADLAEVERVIAARMAQAKAPVGTSALSSDGNAVGVKDGR